jgi:uncharacterized membrane protein
MVEFENRIAVERPIAEVFAFLANFENIPKWNYYVLKVSKMSEGAVAVGTTYHQIRKTDEQMLQVTELEPVHRVAVKTLPGSSPQLEMRFTLQAQGSNTQIQDMWRLDTGRPALIEKLAAGNIKSAVSDNLEKLKQLLENGQVTLQDGRIETLTDIRG